MKERKEKKRNYIMLFLLLLLLTALLVGCGNKGNEDATVSAPVRNTVIIASSNEPPTLDPTHQTSLMSKEMCMLMYNRLFTVDADLKVVPDLINTYKTLSDTEWEMQLKSNVKFHDGSILNSADVKATIEYASESSFAEAFISDVKDVEIIDDLTVKITTKKPSPLLPMNLTQSTLSILPKALIDAGHDFNAEPCGTGPYKFINWDLGNKLEFEMNEEYFDKERMPSIKYLTWKIIPEGSSRTIALEAGEVDFLYDVATIDLPTLTENPETEVLMKESCNLMYLDINHEVKPFNNVLLRKAINAAIDKKSIVEVALDGRGSPGVAAVPNGLQGFSAKNAVSYDINAAKKYLKESGVDPSTLSFPILCTNDEKRRVASVIQANLAEIGINAEIVSIEYATYLSKCSQGDFIASLGGVANFDALSWMKRVYHSSQIGAANFARFNDPEVDALINKALVTVDTEARLKIVTECIEKVNDQCVLCPLYQNLWIRAYNKDLGGVDINAATFTYFQDFYWK